jgi:hypothetical protein
VINHARTLLLNRSGNGRPAPDFFLEELVEDSFSAVALPPFLRIVYDTLIGSSDNALANYRLRQYMKILHSTEFAEYVLALDPRITYLNEKNILSELFGPSYVNLNGSTTLYLSGRVKSEQRLEHDWVVEVIDNTTVKSIYLQENRSSSVIVGSSSGLSDLIPMTGQPEFQARIGSDVPLTAGTKWHVKFFLQPSEDLADALARMEKLSEVTLAALFPRRDPFNTFRDLWKKHFMLQYRMSGLLLAYAYHAEEARVRG